MKHTFRALWIFPKCSSSPQSHGRAFYANCKKEERDLRF